MPRRSTRSSPASRTSLSEPTGSASLAMAMVGNLTAGVPGPVERGPDLPQALLRRGVAERSGHAGVIERARVEAERGGGLVVAREVGVEHRRVVGRDRAEDAGRDEARQRVVVEARDRAGAQVRERADIEDRAARDELADEAGILLGPDAVAEPVCLEALERAPNGRGARDFPRVRDRAEAERLRVLEHVLVRLGRILGFEPAEADSDDAAVAVARAPVDRLARLLLREPARDVRRQPDLDAVLLLRFLRAVAHAFEDVRPRAAVPHAFRRAEDPLEVDRAVGRRLSRVVDDHLAVVLFLLQCVRREDPHLDEVAEVAEAVERLEVV